jgi:uncharacterized protein (DUF305 family)
MIELIKELEKYGAESFIIATCFVSIIVFLVRRLEATYKWCKAKLNVYYAHKRGEELEEETIEKMMNKINEHSKKIQEIEDRASSNVQMFLEHEQSAIEMIENLTKMFVDKEIDDCRWEIINFATRIIDKKPCNKESYKHCLRTYEKYEKLIKDHNLKNGEVKICMELINESYEQKLKEGF